MRPQKSHAEVALLLGGQKFAPSSLPREFRHIIRLEADEALESKLEAILNSTGSSTVHCFETADTVTLDRITGCLLARDCEIVWHQLPTSAARKKTRR